MSVLAKDAEPGKIYRLTRDPGTTYYKICDAAARRRLEARLSRASPRTMTPADRFALGALQRVKEAGEILAVRVLRFRADGEPRESKSYVSFPATYPLREALRPPGYSRPTSKRKDLA